MATELEYRTLSLSDLDQDAYFALYQKVYGGTDPLTRRWQWEYNEHPQKDAIRFIVAEDGSRLAAATTRLPFDLKINDRVERAYFSVDSMVDADYRRLGIMQRLYAVAAESMPLLYSKGAMPRMYKLLMKFGYQPVTPNTFLVCYLRPLRLLLKRFGWVSRPAVGPAQNTELGGYHTLNRFGEEFDRFRKQVAERFEALVVKTSEYMNWRFVDISHKTYHSFYRKNSSGDIAAIVVLSVGDAIGKIVDILWDPSDPSEPRQTISFSRSFAKKSGCEKLLCWGTHIRLRAALKQQRFLDRGETPRFSVYSTSWDMSLLKEGGVFHFMDGDGDFDFL